MYDIIGDIHGHADELELLLQKMDYQKVNGTYRHPDNRQAVFVGDYIDRGPKVKKTLHLVRDMVEAGTAKAIMGNHEFNALCYHTTDPNGKGYLREHSEKNRKQHFETLNEFKDKEDEWDSFLKWFKTLPLYLDLEPFRVVHACWDNDHINWLEKHNQGMDEQFLQKASS